MRQTDHQATLLGVKRHESRNRTLREVGMPHDVPLLTIGLASEARSTGPRERRRNIPPPRRRLAHSPIRRFAYSGGYHHLWLSRSSNSSAAFGPQVPAA
jgi:hypothetical protein